MTRRTKVVQSVKLKKSHTNLQQTVVKMDIRSVVFSMMNTHNMRQTVHHCWLRMGLQSKETFTRPWCMHTCFYNSDCFNIGWEGHFCLCSCCWFWTKICLCCQSFWDLSALSFFDSSLMEEHKDRGTRKWSHLLCDKCQNN